MDQRKQDLISWLYQQTSNYHLVLKPIINGASFRRFYRFNNGNHNYIAMDAPPELEDSEKYINVTAKLAASGLAVPQIYAADRKNGFIWLEDFGDNLYFSVLNTHNADHYYGNACKQLLLLHQANLDLPMFNQEILRQRLSGFHTLFIEQYLGITLTRKAQQIIQHTFDYLIENALCQPQVPIHYDYHSQNLLLRSDHSIGIVDFQDAQIGPITYDLASLLRDCYLEWSTTRVRRWVGEFYHQLQQHHLLTEQISLQQFNTWFDLCGMKRHLRASFVFARKWLRDNDRRYLNYLPRTLGYVHQVCQQHHHLLPFGHLLEQKLLPLIHNKEQVQ